MKTLKLTIAILAIAALNLQLYASRQEFKKTITKSFEVKKDALLVLENKFGKINCTNWDKNEVAIEVEITVEASNQEKADKYFGKINVDIDGNNDKVSVITDFDDNLFKKDKSDNVSVDFMISMPESISVDIDHKFGDLILASVKGKSIIDLSYGSIKAKELGGNNNEVEIKFSEGYIGYLGDVELELKYSELEIDEATSMSAESKFSQLEIGKVDVLTLESGYDEDMIGWVRDMDVESEFSEVEIRSLEDRLVADFDYGELRVKEISAGFKLVDLINSFSDASIGFNPDASYRMIATVKMGDLSYPKDKARLTEVELSYTSNKYEGIIGDNSDTVSKVMIDSKNSGVHIFYR